MNKKPKNKKAALKKAKTKISIQKPPVRPPKAATGNSETEIADLRNRLREAEETLQAIRSGAVDALVVSGPQGESVFTLKSAESPYRVLVESMNEGAANVSSEGLVLYCNDKLGSLLGRPLNNLLGRPLRGFVAAEDLSAYDALVKKGLHRSASAELTLLRSRGPLAVNCSCRPLKLAGVRSLSVVVSDISGLKQAEQKLRKANEELEQRVRERTAELEASRAECEVKNKELITGRDFLRSYARHLIEREEDIKKKLAADLHDELGQNLTFLSINFSMLKKVLPAEMRKKLGARLKDLNDQIENSGHSVRNIMSDLRPPILDEYGLPAALRWQSGLISKRTGIKVDLGAVDTSLKMPREVQPTLFRIAQEALINITKHAKASCVTIELRSAGGRIRLVVSDNGRGFEPPRGPIVKAKSGWGLTIMRERALSIGGKFHMVTARGKGTMVVVEIPTGHTR